MFLNCSSNDTNNPDWATAMQEIGCSIFVRHEMNSGSIFFLVFSYKQFCQVIISDRLASYKKNA